MLKLRCFDENYDQCVPESVFIHHLCEIRWKGYVPRQSKTQSIDLTYVQSTICECQVKRRKRFCYAKAFIVTISVDTHHLKLDL